MILHDEAVDIVCKWLQTNGASYVPFKEDLIDHMCCMIEEAMGNGISFEEASERSKAHFGPAEVEILQESTLFLIKGKWPLKSLLLVASCFVGLVWFCWPNSATDGLACQQVSVPVMPQEINFAGEELLANNNLNIRFDKELTDYCFQHEAVLLMLKRAYRYFPIIEPILQEEKVPNDLKYLAVLESQLSNSVSASNAKGIWQFIPETARTHGLEVTKEIDERYHIAKATKAACQYLKRAYRKFGSWTLAAAAYHVGEGTLRKQLEGQNNCLDTDWFLGGERAHYIFSILAIKTIMGAPDKYGFNGSLCKNLHKTPTK